MIALAPTPSNSTRRRHDRRATGKAARELGRRFEAELAHAHRAYATHGQAKIDALPVPTSPVSGKIRGLVQGRFGPGAASRLRQLSAKQGYDYAGFLGPNAGTSEDPGLLFGLPIVAEAKCTSMRRPSMTIDPAGGNAGIKPHQLQALAEAWRDWGAVAAIVWLNGERELVLMPDEIVAAWDAFAAGGRKSIPTSRFHRYEVVPYPGHGPVHDWLYEVRRWLFDHGRPSVSRSTHKVYDMIEHRIDEQNRRVLIPDPERQHGPHEVAVERCDRAHIEQLAREATSPADLADKVSRLRVADERG